MGVSFKIAKRGTKFKPPKPVISDTSKFTNDVADTSFETSKLPSKDQFNGKDEDQAVGLTGSISSGRDPSSADDEVSFILNLYSDGYSIGKASENHNCLQTAFQEGLKLLHPYDRTSEGLLTAIECGRLPGSILDDIPCKFVEGAIICEIDLGLAGLRKRRLRHIPEVTVMSTNRPHGKKICIDRAPDSSSCGDVISQHAQDSVAAQGLVNQRKMYNAGQGLALPPGPSLAGHDMQISYANNMNATTTGKMDGQEGQLLPYSTASKRARIGSSGSDGSDVVMSRLLMAQVWSDTFLHFPGRIICNFETVRDFRKCMFDPRSNIPSLNRSGIINKVHLKMSLENVVKDIPLMADDSWTYGDLMEVESQILKALQPKLCLEPVPRLDRLCGNPTSSEIDLGLAGLRKRRLRHIPEVTVMSTNRPHGKKICIDRAPDSSSCGDVISQHAQDSVAAQGLVNQRKMYNAGQGLALPPGPSLAGHDMQISYANNMNATTTGKMDGQEGQLLPYSTASKRARIGSSGSDGSQQQQIGSFVDGFQGSDVQWRNQLLRQQSNPRGIQYENLGTQKFTQHAGDGTATLDSVKLEPNLLRTDMQMMEAETSHLDPRAQQRFPHPFMRPTFQQPGWSNFTQQVEKDERKEDPFSKRKSIQSPRISAGAVAQSPLSAKSADMSCGSMGAHFGAVSSADPLGQGQRERAGLTSNPAAGRATSITSSANDSLQQQHQAQLASKRRSNSLPKTPIISGVGSPARVNTMGGPMNASSPSVCTPQFTEQGMLERFAKVEVVAMRHQLNCKKNKVDGRTRKPRAFSPQELVRSLAGAANNEYDDDSKMMSKSLVGGHMNMCKIRVVNVRLGMQGNMNPAVGTRLILSEKPNDGVVAMHYGDLTDGDYLYAEDFLPTLPNTHWADLLAAQFCALMIRERYAVDEVVQPRPPRLSIASNDQASAPGVVPNTSAVDAQQFSEPFSGQLTETKPTISNTSMNSTANVQPSSGMLPPGNSQPLQMSQGLVSGVNMPQRQQQMDQQPLQQSSAQQQLPPQNQSPLMQQQQPRFQRSPIMLPTNSMSQLNAFGQSSNLPMGNHMGNNPSPLQMLQQPQQQPAQMQRRMMMVLGPAMGMGNNMVGLGGLTNVMGIGGARGLGGAGISAPMGPMSGMGANMGKNQMGLSQANAISQHLRAGTLNPQAANAIHKFKMMQASRAMLGEAQAGVAGMSGAARQMQPGAAGLSMLGQSLNRGNINQLQRAALGQMGQMGLPKLMPGMNVPMNQQHLQLQQQQQHQQLQQQHLQQLHQQQQQQQQQQPQQPQQQIQQQEATSPLQAVLSPQQVSSPSTLGIPQQMNQQLTPQQQPSPQQMGQRTPMSPPLSSGPIHPMSAGNPEVCPASPALSS